MPREPIFHNLRAQRTAIAVVMIVVFAGSVLVSWLVSGASLGNPLSPLDHATGPTQAPQTPTVRPMGVAITTLGPTRFALPDVFEPTDDARGLPDDGLHATWVDAGRQTRTLTAVVLLTDQPTPPDAVALAWIEEQSLMPTRDVGPEGRFIADTLRGYDVALLPQVTNGGRTGTLDVIAAVSADGRRHLLLHLSDQSPHNAQTGLLIHQGTTILRQMYRHARFEPSP